MHANRAHLLTCRLGELRLLRLAVLPAAVLTVLLLLRRRRWLVVLAAAILPILLAILGCVNIGWPGGCPYGRLREARWLPVARRWRRTPGRPLLVVADTATGEPTMSAHVCPCVSVLAQKLRRRRPLLLRLLLRVLLLLLLLLKPLLLLLLLLLLP